MRSLDTAFGALRINKTSNRGWAVVGKKSGAIAVGDDDCLLMKMSEDEARRMARILSETENTENSGGMTGNRA